jgi:bacterioferritin-associated ferredoxin
MLACSCHAVSVSHVHALIEEGASDEGEIGLRCGAGTDCGSCIGRLGRILEQARGTGSACPREVAGVGV